MGKLVAEYILNGDNIKVGSRDAAKAGAVIGKDFVSAAVIRVRLLYSTNTSDCLAYVGWMVKTLWTLLPTASAARGRSMALLNRRNQKT